jgi:tRNA pseudouridine38-40 synthase
VHALAQAAAFSIHNPIPCSNLVRAMNRLLARSVRVISAEEVAGHFHPRYDSVAKTYEYRIWRCEICPPFDWPYVHHHPYPLNEAAMADCASLIEGEHDFSAFASTDEKDDLGRSKVRRVYSSKLTREGSRLNYRVRGSGFLKHMVRNIVGVLLEVGKGNLGAEDIRLRLEPGCGISAGPTAPGCGLFLVNVEY